MTVNNVTIHEVYKDSLFMYKDIPWSEYTSLQILRQCEQFEYRPDDIIVATYPRSGTTLTQEIVWHIVNHEIVEKDKMYGGTWKRFPFMEFNEKKASLSTTSEELNPIDSLPMWTTKRLIKTHLPFSFIREQFDKVNPKLVFVTRNPKDNVVSRFNFSKGLGSLVDGVPFEMFWQIYMNGLVTYGDFRDFNQGYWSLRDRANVLVVRYEDIVHQPFQEIHKIALFLGYSLSDEKIKTIVHNTTFDIMSKNKDVNRSLSVEGQFLRKGKVGDWKNWLTVAQSETMDAWIAAKLRCDGLRFIYE